MSNNHEASGSNYLIDNEDRGDNEVVRDDQEFIGDTEDTGNTYNEYSASNNPSAWQAIYDYMNPSLQANINELQDDMDELVNMGDEYDVNPEYSNIGADPANPEETNEEFRDRLISDFMRLLLLEQFMKRTSGYR